MQSSAHKSGWFFRPVCWEDANAELMPGYLSPTEAVLRWVADLQCPLWIDGQGQKAGEWHIKLLAEKLQRWPEPIDIPDIEKLKHYHFNDELKF